MLGRACISLIVLAGIALAGPAQAQDAAVIYEAAYKALEEKDCRAAIPLLERYMKMEEQKLNGNPKAKADLEEQIRLCKKKLEGPSVDISPM